MTSDTRTADTPNKSRLLFVIVVAGIVLAYTSAVIGGTIPKTRQLDGTHLTLLFVTLLVCTVTLRPQTLDRFARLEGLGFKIELLQRLQERQVAQAEELQRLDLIIPLLFRDGHLNNLLHGATAGYHGGGTVRDELRRLRAIGLLRSLPERNISDLHGDTEFNLSDWVTLPPSVATGLRDSRSLEKL